jgi:hypothetical protein
MSGVHELLDRLKQLGATLSAEGDRLIVRAGSQAVPGPLITELRQSKSEVLEAISSTNPEAQFWAGRLLVLTRDWSAGNRGLDSAAKLARENLINEWHAKHGKRTPAWQCAGCGKPIAGVDSIRLPDGNRVHLEPIDCMIDFGRRWRNEAKTALVSLGVTCGIASEI